MCSGRRVHQLGDAFAQLWIVYQPIVELRGRKVVGYEALSRFGGDPQSPPDVWFAAARTAGLGTNFEVGAVSRALDVPAEMISDRHLSVNVSPDTLCAPRLLETLAPRANEMRVIVELTEHEGIDDYERLAAAVTQLRGIGVSLAVDDAGAGFSSMRHILDLRPEMIKLDRSLISQIAGDPGRRALVVALRTFGEQVGAELCAEGIETAEEARILEDLGIVLGQGFHLGRPGPLPLDPPT